MYCAIYGKEGLVVDKDLYHPYINENGKHYIYTTKGGLQNYHDEIGAEYIHNFEALDESVYETIPKFV